LPIFLRGIAAEGAVANYENAGVVDAAAIAGTPLQDIAAICGIAVRVLLLIVTLPDESCRNHHRRRSRVTRQGFH
jgi:hypothetical protein